MKFEITIKGLTLLFLVLYLVLIVCPQEIAYATEEFSDKYEAVIMDSKRRKRTIIEMEKGEIKITTKAHAASDTSTIRWKLVGFTITKVPLAECTYDYKAEEKTYHLNGYKDVNTVYEYGWGEMFFNNAFERESDTDYETGIKTTVTEFNKSQVTYTMKEDFGNLAADTTLYLHGIFCVYTLDKNGKETPHKGEDQIKNWKEILLAEWWDRKDNQLDDFRYYFNIPLVYKPADQQNTVYYYIDGKSENIDHKELAPVKPGVKVSWKDEPAIMIYPETDGRIYELYKYEVKVKGTDKVIESGTLGVGGCTLENIRSGTTTVMLGGMNINLYYRPKKDPTIQINAVDKETGQILRKSMHITTCPAGADYTANLLRRLEVNGVSYKKTGEYSFTYEKESGRTGTENGLISDDGSSDTTFEFAFKVPEQVKAGTKIIVSVYYEAVDGDVPISVVAVDENNQEELMEIASERVRGGDKYSCDVPESIEIEDKTYELTGRWTWQYIGNTSTTPTVRSGTGEPVSLTVPLASLLTPEGIIVKVYYKYKISGSDKINLRVNMVSENGKLIERISEETVTRGQKISKTVQATRSMNKIVYTYQKKWECKYLTPEGEKTISGTGSPAIFEIPSETNLGTVVTLNLYYKTIQKVEVPERANPITLKLDNPTPYGVINGDKYGSPYFISEQGIPTTESQYVYVKTKDYLLGYELVNRTGVITFKVPVTMRYTLNYWTATPEWAGGPKPVTDTVEDTQEVYIDRAYSYWEIANIELYCINSAKVNNYSLPGGGVTLTADNTYLNLPSLVTWHSSSVNDHVLPPIQAITGITVEAEPITSDTSDRPRIEYEDLTSYAVEMCGEARVRNDRLIFNGGTVLSHELAEKITQAPDTTFLKQSNTIIPDKTLHTEGQIVEAAKANGYYSSNGYVCYSLHPSSVSSSYNTMLYNMTINSVIIHTPVICDPVITEDNTKWSQVVDPVPDAVQIVLDPDTTLNDFTVRISNTLQHSNRPGYYTRDFSRSLINPEYISYLAREDGIVRNEMKLPFDVYLDTYGDYKTENDRFIKAGTWIVLGRNTFRFYVPMWVREGTYTVQFRAVAVNGTDKLEWTETTRNASWNNYVATASRRFQVSGRIYGFTIYDVSDYPKWENVFRMGNTMYFKYFDGAIDGTLRQGFNQDYAYYYTVGTRDQYGNDTGRLSKYTLPMVNGSHPKYKNLGVLKTGYAIRFRLDTTGEMYDGACMVKIIPTFYYVDAKGKNRQRVDLYYDEEIYGKQRRVVKVGGELDLVNIKEATTGNLYNRIPERELRNTAAVMNTNYSRWIEQRSVLYSYNQIRMTAAFRTFIGTDYASAISSAASFSEVSKSGHTELSLSKYMQRWYGTYKIPEDVHAVPAGFDVDDYMKKNGIDYQEDFWLRDGYIIVNFDIVTYDYNGKKKVSYINDENYLNNGNCSMWVTEGMIPKKTDNKGNVFQFKAGDVIVYYTDKKYSDDYEGRMFLTY